MYLSSLILLSVTLAGVSANNLLKFDKRNAPWSSEANVLQFQNLGFPGKYFPVSKIEATNSKNCTCLKDLDNPVNFSGPISPLNEELSVHLRGPINLRKFGWYIIDSYNSSQTEGNWTRLSYFDAIEGTADNITFLGNVGDNNLCLGKALDYVTSDGLSLANSSTILSNTTIPSAREFAIFSGIECQDDDCGIYRDGSQAYHGFYGTNKMFLFEFAAPSDLSEEKNKTKTDNYDMPGIWLLNAQIPRTSQYPTNSNCSSWDAGSGEFDIFEVMNITERNHFFSTIHDYQGTDALGVGLQNFGYLERTPNHVMKGGVIFGEDGTATIFLSNDTDISSEISNTDLNSWLTDLEDKGEIEETILPTVLSVSATNTAVSSISKSSKAEAADGISNVGMLSVISAVLFGYFI